MKEGYENDIANIHVCQICKIRSRHREKILRSEKIALLGDGQAKENPFAAEEFDKGEKGDPMKEGYENDIANIHACQICKRKPRNRAEILRRERENPTRFRGGKASIKSRGR